MIVKLYVTRGCQACSIMNRLLIKACMDIGIEPPKVYEYKKGEFNIKNLTDFPTTIVLDDNCNEKFRLVGTYPKDYIINCLTKAKD